MSLTTEASRLLVEQVGSSDELSGAEEKKKERRGERERENQKRHDDDDAAVMEVVCAPFAFIGECCFYASALPLFYVLYNMVSNDFENFTKDWSSYCTIQNYKRLSEGARGGLKLHFNTTVDFAALCVPWCVYGSIVLHPLCLAIYTFIATLCVKRRLIAALNGGWRRFSNELSQIWSDVSAVLLFPFTCWDMSRNERILAYTQGVFLLVGYLNVYGILAMTVSQFIGPEFIQMIMIFAGQFTLKNFVILFLTIQVYNVAVNMVFHRYFAHAAFETSRPMQFVLAVYGCLSLQRGPLWWASMHRTHHVHCDTEHDPHGRRKGGFMYSHFGWFIQRHKMAIKFEKIPQFHYNYELLILEMYSGAIGRVLTDWVLVGFAGENSANLARYLAYHGQFCINSICHPASIPKSKDNEEMDDTAQKKFTGDDCIAHDIWLLGVCNGGEGFHSAHHETPWCAKHGRRHWYNLDITYCCIYILEKLRLVWNVQHPGQPDTRKKFTLGNKPNLNREGGVTIEQSHT